MPILESVPLDFGSYHASSQFIPLRSPLLIRTHILFLDRAPRGLLPTMFHVQRDLFCLKGLSESEYTLPELSLGPATLSCLDSEPEKSLVASESIFSQPEAPSMPRCRKRQKPMARSCGGVCILHSFAPTNLGVDNTCVLSATSHVSESISVRGH